MPPLYEQPQVCRFDINSPASVDSLVEQWKNYQFHPIPISGISAKGCIAVHVYHYAPYGNDTVFFSNIVKELSNRISSLITSADDFEDRSAEAPQVFTLSQNSPNPFNSATVIEFRLIRAAEVRLAVYDALGRRVAVPAGGSFPAGRHAVLWDGRDSRGIPVSSGVYLYRLTAGWKAETRRMTILR